MPDLAPIPVPVVFSAAGASVPEAARMFRLARGVAIDRILLGTGLPESPEWLAGPLRLSLHLPGEPMPLRCGATAAEVVVGRDTDGERAERRALLLSDLPPEAALRIERYVEERLNVR
jgi:hypothetical protein